MHLRWRSAARLLAPSPHAPLDHDDAAGPATARSTTPNHRSFRTDNNQIRSVAAFLIVTVRTQMDSAHDSKRCRSDGARLCRAELYPLEDEVERSGLVPVESASDPALRSRPWALAQHASRAGGCGLDCVTLTS